MSQSFERSLDCLFVIANSKSPISIDEIAVQTNLPASSVYRLLRPLEKHQLVERVGQGGRVLGLGALALYSAARNIHGDDIVNIALPVMRDLAEKTRETILLTAFLGLDVICVEAIPSSQSVRLSPQKGLVQTPLAGCSSKILLAFADPDLREKIILGHEPPVMATGERVNPGTLRLDLENIRTTGYAITIEEVDPQSSGVAAPIFDRDNRVIAGLTAAGPNYRFDEDRMPKIIEWVVQAAQLITDRCSVLDDLKVGWYRGR